MPTKAVRLTMPLVGEANAAGYLVMVPGASVLIRQNGVALVGSAGPGTAAVFSDNAKTPMTNPVPTGVTPGTAGVDTDGRLLVYLNPGSGYDVQATVGNVTTTAPLPDVSLDVADVTDVADFAALEAEVDTKVAVESFALDPVRLLTDPVTISDVGINTTFPSACVVDGNFLVAYRSGSNHNVTTDGVVKVVRSTDRGRTWTLVYTEDATPLDTRDPSLTTLSDGRVALIFNERDINVSNYWEPFIRFSEDGGLTWGARVPIDFNANLAICLSKVIETDNGRLMVAGYGIPVESAPLTDSMVVFSDDDGATWTGRITVADGEVAGFDYQEPTLAKFADGEIIIFHRTSEAAAAAYYQTSDDNGATWSALTALPFATKSKHSIHVTADDVLVLAYRRSLEPRLLTIRWSTDRGATWSEVVEIDGAGGESYFTYGEWLEPTPNQLALVYGYQRSDTDAIVRYTARPWPAGWDSQKFSFRDRSETLTGSKTVSRAASTDVAFATRVTGDTNDRVQILAGGRINMANGTELPQLGLDISADRTAVGRNAALTATGTGLTAFGDGACRQTTGAQNTGTGYNALVAATSGFRCTANGYRALAAVTTGFYNSAVGRQAGLAITTTSYQTLVGMDSDATAGPGFDRGCAFGYAAKYGAVNAVALGAETQALHASAVALGRATVTTAADQVAMGARHLETTELGTDPAAPATNAVRVYARDNGAGKTQWCVRFATGAVQVLATEP